MKQISLDKSSLYEIFSGIGLPVLSGILFIVWAFYFLKFTVFVLPLIFFLVLALYFVSGPVYAGMLLTFAAGAGLFSIIIVSDSGGERVALIFEIIWLIAMFYLIEQHRLTHVRMHHRMDEEYEVLDREIVLKESEIIEAKKKCLAISQKIKNFQTLGKIIQSFEASLDEKDIISLSSELAAKFIGKGNWQLKKSIQADAFARYIKVTGLPLLINDLSLDKRFVNSYGKYLSVLAIPIELNGTFWGVLRGTAPEANAFDDSDLRLLSILSSTITTVLYNAQLYQKTQDLAVTDGLTGLYTQTFFKERLDEEIKRAKHNALPLTVCLLDIDFFKKINDTYGHQAGDIILTNIASLLRRRFRETDILSRYGGEEFGVIMLNTDAAEAEKVLEGVRKTIEQERFFIPIESYKPVQLKITISIGFAELSTLNSSGPEDFLKKADASLYKAKNSGRNRVCVYEKSYE
jgi:diguanylate cyclase (GGDEF)-like protein